MRAATLEAEGEFAPEIADGLKKLFGGAKKLNAAPQARKGPARTRTLRRRSRVWRQSCNRPSAARQHDRLAGTTHLVGESAEIATCFDDGDALRHMST